MVDQLDASRCLMYTTHYMARVVTQLPDPVRVTRKVDADYAQYLDGQVWLISPEDVTVPLYSLRATLVSQARRRGLTLKSRLSDQLHVQAVPK